MGTRIRGAVLAFAAALLVAASVPLAWWSGPPVDGGSGKVVEGKSVAIGLLGFEGCRGVGGAEEDCVTRSHTDAKSGLHAGMNFAIAGFATLASALLAALLMIGQGLARLGDRQALRRKLAIGSLIASAFVGVAGAAFVLLAPDVHGVPRGVGPFVAFGGAALGIVQALLAMRPDRAPKPKVEKPAKAKAVKAPKPQKAPKQPKPAKHRPELPPIAPPPPPPGGYAPIDFLALMEEDAGQQETVPKVPAMPWEQHHQAAPSNSLPGPAAVLGTSMPSLPQPPPPPPVYGGNGGVPSTSATAPTMFPHAPYAPMPPSPPPPMPMPFAPTSSPHAPTQAIVPVPSWVPPNPLPSTPFVMGQTPPPGTMMPGYPLSSQLAPTTPDSLPAPTAGPDAHTQPPTAIPLPPLFGSPPPPDAASTGAPPPPARKTMPPPIRNKPVTQQPPPGGSTAPPPFGLPIPMAAMAALGRPVALDADSRAGTDIASTGDNTAPTDAVPEGAEPTDMGPLIEPPAPQDLDGRHDTASDMMETIERSGSEAEAMRKGLRRSETPPPFKTVDRAVEDETVPRERPSASQILTSAPKTPAPTPAAGKPPTTPPPVAATPAPVQHTPTPQQKTPIPITTASPDLPPPSEGQSATDGPAPACPQCDSPMNWVEKHLRFYCQTCRMYF